jgi:hypothetical protein
MIYRCRARETLEIQGCRYPGISRWKTRNMEIQTLHLLDVGIQIFNVIFSLNSLAGTFLGSCGNTHAALTRGQRHVVNVSVPPEQGISFQLSFTPSGLVRSSSSKLRINIMLLSPEALGFPILLPVRTCRAPTSSKARQLPALLTIHCTIKSVEF